MIQRYKHTQVGYVILAALGAGLLFILWLMLNSGFSGVGLIVLVILALCLGLFATLTVELDEEKLMLRFGPGLIRKVIWLKDIAACRVVKNPWYYGWGIKLIPGGWLFNVSGLWAVEVQLKNGRRYRIGTDDAEGLAQALESGLFSFT
jgi:hypothetical protein